MCYEHGLALGWSRLYSGGDIITKKSNRIDYTQWHWEECPYGQQVQSRKYIITCDNHV